MIHQRNLENETKSRELTRFKHHSFIATDFVLTHLFPPRCHYLRPFLHFISYHLFLSLSFNLFLSLSLFFFSICFPHFLSPSPYLSLSFFLYLPLPIPPPTPTLFRQEGQYTVLFVNSVWLTSCRARRVSQAAATRVCIWSAVS